MKKFRSERGAAAIEFALIVPVLLVLALGIIEFGRAYWVQTELSGAAREGVRIMALQNNAGAARTAAKSAATGITLTDSQIAVGPSCPASNTSSVSATVTITYPMTFLTGMFGSGLTLYGKGVMRCNG